ncbi:cytochrome c oxidase assembly protein [Sphingomonas sp.]|uniref:cytochrome c oxidase assembly protein n=1 Tax=Sphingomonas sp. TaxID=28214 RepID=UPI002CBBDCFD|nr:cytochrome c oxidase assembly protein [Sphingomonas sp.]HTG37543.1 cytochrome c oxidase assembly protein [Sphingomonas sp.]
MKRRVSLGAGALLLPVGWWLAAGGFGMTGHMAGHMLAVAVAAPLIALGLSGTRADPATRWPRHVTPMGAMLIELAVVWGWHLPALRAAADAMRAAMVLEQAMYLAAGFLLWSSVLAARHRASGIGALLLTSMHMTLLGALIGLAPRPLYDGTAIGHHGLEPLADQQLGGVVMLMIGAASYLIGGLAMLAGLLRMREVST